MKLQVVIPILRIFDAEKAVEFYIDYLGFQLDWEHRFEDHLPLYMQVSKDQLRLHLSEHYGDCTPGAAIRIEMEEVTAFQRSLLEKQYRFSRPGLERTSWGTEECCVTDPFGNRIIFYEEINNSV
ncbi:glyoxalase superfamily protein [Gorillibacterium sp. sgz5001074]|uniref:glyoxalase superfamily protein n=1 Tax=Gorillibacterium sp. sgz5001074 TaxID=3446695 RepID=UPI003F66E71C